MQEHFSFIASVIPHDPVMQKYVSALIVVLVLIAIAFFASTKIKTAEERKSYIVPKRFSLVGLLDFFVESFVHYHDGILGVENRKTVPFCGSVFLLILITNIIGLFPGMVAPTTTIVINFAIALVVFIYFNYLGVRANGLVNYLRHFAGPILLLSPLFFLIEIFSTLVRVLTLNLRLYWNISADHLVMEAFMGLHPLLGVVTYCLGFFVAFMQAFVFTTLTIVYIQLAVQHSEEE